jgi:hypothetical protein
MRTTTAFFAGAFALIWLVVAASHAQQAKVPTAEDTRSATEIEHRLSNDREVNAQNVDIDVRGGVVTLTGRVPSVDAKERAEKLTASVPGINQVRNELAVSGGRLPAPVGERTIPEQMPGRE